MTQELDTEHLLVFAEKAAVEHGMADATITLLNVSENATYRLDSSDGRRIVLRVHRTGYHSQEAIHSELTWVRSLRDEGIVSTARVVLTPDGREVVAVTHPGGEQRFVVAFEWMNGVHPPEDRLVDDFVQLGAITARLHGHAKAWRPPAGFTRFTWDYDTSLGDRGHWGRWQDGLGMGPAELDVLSRCSELLRRRLEAFGKGPDRFGLVHADMRLANLLVDGSHVGVIDFDDCGFSWYLYDLGSSLSFIEHLPIVPELIDAWVTGYRTVAPLSAAEVDELPTFVMLRRLLLVAWIGSHSAVPEAQALGAGFTIVSCDLAETYLSTFS
ncbi:MAG TPA: phosphotransferase [Candidatus Nanopelagicales bacterium]